MTIQHDHSRIPVLSAALCIAVSGCSLISDPGETVVLEVAESRVSCVVEGAQECYIVRENSNGPLQLFYDGILGFDYTPGFRYRLLVTRSRNDPVLADGSLYTYRLERELSRERSPRSDLLDQIAAAEAKWRAADLASYEMVEQRQCFCASASLGSVRLEVTRDHSGAIEHVTSARRVEDDSPVPAEIAAEFLSVRSLFSFIRWSIADDAHRIDVEFDDDLGYPLRVSTDRRANVSDDEIEYVVESVTP